MCITGAKAWRELSSANAKLVLRMPSPPEMENMAQDDQASTARVRSSSQKDTDMEKIAVLILRDTDGATWTVPESHVKRKGRFAIWFGRTCRVLEVKRWFVAELSRALTRKELDDLGRKEVGDFSTMDTRDGRESFIIFEDRSIFDHLRHLTKSQPLTLPTGGGKLGR
jgi:hypothetical protein